MRKWIIFILSTTLVAPNMYKLFLSIQYGRPLLLQLSIVASVAILIVVSCYALKGNKFYTWILIGIGLISGIYVASWCLSPRVENMGIKSVALTSGVIILLLSIGLVKYRMIKEE